MNTIRVVAAVVDTKQLTLYKEDGTSITIPQGDARLAKIVNAITPILAQGPGSVAEIQLDMPEDTYTQFEAQSQMVQLFRVAKSFLTELFKVLEPKEAPPVAPMAVGTYPSNPRAQPMVMAVQEIMAHAKPVTSNEPMSADDTVIAKVGNEIITGVERLKPQMARAVELGSSKGMDAFFKRVAAVSAERRHSVEDLLRFMERGDLPVAEDGSIVIYKVLRRNGEAVYVDCHTKKVTQRVGSYVCMAPELVDPDRRNECSSGLHVARRAYVGGFAGNVCVLAKVAPEDVIAVPDYDANKMRVCGYHILFELSDAAFSLLKSNRPFTDNEEAKILLGRALCGDHPAPIERVEITEHKGGGVKITPLGKHQTPEKILQRVQEAVAKAEALPDEGEGGNAPAVDPKAVSASVVAEKAQVKTRAQKARDLWMAFVRANTPQDAALTAQALLDYKRSTKLGWQALDLPSDTGDELQSYLTPSD